MSENTTSAPDTGTLAPEEIEAAMAANASDEMERLQRELSELKAKSADLADQFLRAKAEAENARRRADDEVAKARKFGIESFAESLLPVLDSLEAGLAIPNATLEQIREGSEATLRQLKSALERNKVVEVNPRSVMEFFCELKVGDDTVRFAAARQRSEQNLTSAQLRSHFFRQVMARPHTAQGFWGSPALLPLNPF